ncbi:MAG: NAD-dependent epimerase/dehydratase family protein [Methylophilaceae bacterium]
MSQPHKTLLIGGAGFIGSHMIPFLKEAGREVTIVGRSDIKKHHIAPSVEYVQGDFSSLDFIAPLIETHDEIVLLAYATVPNTSYDDPLVDLKENLYPSVQLFIEIAKRGKKLVLVSSGGTVYGEQVYDKTKETMNKRPISSYGLTKLTLENYAFLYGVLHGLKFVIVRPTNAYGVGQVPFSGQGFIATAVACAHLHKPINIFGETGTIRDYVYITDLARGVVDVMIKGRLSDAYNISTGIGCSNLDIVKKINRILRKYDTTLKVNHLPERPFDVKVNVLENAKIQKHISWQPEVNIDQGLERILADVFKPKSAN